MTESSPCDEPKFDKKVELENIITTPDDLDNGYFVEVDLRNPDERKEETRNFPFSPRHKASPQDNISDYFNRMKPNNFTQKKVLCD